MRRRRWQTPEGAERQVVTPAMETVVPLLSAHERNRESATPLPLPEEGLPQLWPPGLPRRP